MGWELQESFHLVTLGMSGLSALARTRHPDVPLYAWKEEGLDSFGQAAATTLSPAGRDAEAKPHMLKKFRDTMSQMGLSEEQMIVLPETGKSKRQT